MGIGSVKTGDTVTVTAVVVGWDVDGQAGHGPDHAQGQRQGLARVGPGGGPPGPMGTAGTGNSGTGNSGTGNSGTGNAESGSST